jgi:hypothetical protein
MGEEFWLKVKEKIRMQENQQNKNKQLERIKEENLKKDQIKIDKKIEKFNQIVLENPTREHQFKKNKSIRNRERAYRLRCKCVVSPTPKLPPRRRCPSRCSRNCTSNTC